jgi:O-methyltransferase/aklanonic acid methyltransferase
MKASGVVGLFTRAAPTYERVGPRQFSYFAEKLVEFVRIEPGSEVLDVATGTGAVLLAAAHASGGSGRLVGIDVTPEMLSRAAVEIEARSLRNVVVQEMDVERLDFPEGSFDNLLCSFGLQAFANKRTALAGFFRVLKPAGQIGIVFPLGWPFETDPRWSWQADVLRSFGALVTPDDEFSAADLAPALGAAGFIDVEAVEVTFPLDFRDAEEWWSWSWSHGTRVLLEAVPANQRPRLRQALFSGLRSRTGADGVIHGSMAAVLARASKPSD